MVQLWILEFDETESRRRTMPKPIVCLCGPLHQYLEAFRSCFRPRQWKYFVTVLLGLVECEERRTLSGLLRVVGERICLSGLSRFMNKWPWSPAEVAGVWMGRYRARMTPIVCVEQARLAAERPKRVGRPAKTVVTGYLSMDDSVHVKPKGRKMGGLGKHYSTSEQRNVRGHCLFTGLYKLLDQSCPLAVELYRQRRVCEQEGEPFHSKIEMAVSMVERFEPVPGTHTHVLVDSWYHCKALRKAVQRRHWDLSGALKSNRVMRLMAADGKRTWLKLSAYAALLKPEDWTQVIWPSAQGGQTLYVHCLRTWVRKLGPTRLLITRHSLEEPRPNVRYWGSTDLALAPQALVDTLAQRWSIETFFEDAKDLLGSDHYQLMTATAIVRFWTLIACLLAFLEEQRACQLAQPCSRGEVRRTLQLEHRRNLLRWIALQLSTGHSIEQIDAQWTLSSP